MRRGAPKIAFGAFCAQQVGPVGGEVMGEHSLAHYPGLGSGNGGIEREIALM